MPSTKSQEFTSWVQEGMEFRAKKKTFGALTFEANGIVRSYAMVIAKVLGDKKTIVYVEDARTRSRTTASHLRAITYNIGNMSGWTFLPVTEAEMYNYVARF